MKPECVITLPLTTRYEDDVDPEHGVGEPGVEPIEHRHLQGRHKHTSATENMGMQIFKMLTCDTTHLKTTRSCTRDKGGKSNITNKHSNESNKLFPFNCNCTMILIKVTMKMYLSLTSMCDFIEIFLTTSNFILFFVSYRHK